MDKFLYIKDSETEGTLLAEDGGVAAIWHNGEHIVGQCYKERLEAKQVKIGFDHAFEYMAGRSSNSSMFDFEGENTVLNSHLEELANWLVAQRDGFFPGNLTLIDASEISKKELNEKVIEFLNNSNFVEV